MITEEFFIHSLKYKSADGLALFWGPDRSGYTTRLDKAGRYTKQEIEDSPDYLNNGESTQAILVSDVLDISFRAVSYGDFVRGLAGKEQ